MWVRAFVTGNNQNQEGSTGFHGLSSGGLCEH